MTWLLILAIWLVLSLPVAVVCGRILRRRAESLSEPSAAVSDLASEPEASQTVRRQRQPSFN